MKVSDLDIWRLAKVLVKQHGDDAGLYAAQRVDAMAECGDLEGEKTWKRMLRAVEELQRERPDGAAH